MAEEITEKTQSAKLHDDFWVPFQHRADLIATIEEDERFYRGDQWDGDNPTNAPRIVLNRIQDAIRKLASKICGTPLHLAFVSSGNDVDCTALQRYDEFVMAKLGYKAFSFQSAINGENLGTEIVYWYFDGDAPYDIGGFYKGGVMCKHISPKQFAVSNPYEPDIQKQDWVMTWTEQYIRSLEAIIEGDRALSKDEKKKRIEALYQEGRKQYSDSTHADLYLINNTLVRVYMRFFRIKGEVCYTLETENVTLTKYPIPLSKAVSDTYAKAVAKAFADEKNLEYDPKTKEAQLIKDLDFDFPDSIAKGYPERREEDGFERYQERFSLYPFCVWKPKEINDFFFGMSITKLMVPIQQAINYGATLQIRHMQNMAQPKVLAKEEALGGDVWSNDPADNLQIDHTRGDGFGFKTLDVPDMPNDAFKVPDWLTEQMKDTYGFGEILSGTVNGNDMSGYLYSLALKQANSTLEQEQQLFWKFQVDNARIRLMFYKHYVDKRYYTYELDAPEYEKEEQARQTLLLGVKNGLTVTAPDGTPYSKEAIQRRFGKPTSKTQVKSFDGRDLWGLDFDIKIVAQQGLVESQLNTQQWYQQMFGNGQIQQYAENPDLLTFVAETAPLGVVPEEYRATMKHYAKKMEQTLVAQLKQQVQQLSMQVQQLMQGLSQSEQLRNAQQKEFGNRLNAAAALTQNAQKQAQDAQRQMQMQQRQNPTAINEGEVKSNNAKGIPSSALGLQVEQPMI